MYNCTTVAADRRRPPVFIELYCIYKHISLLSVPYYLLRTWAAALYPVQFEFNLKNKVHLMGNRITAAADDDPPEVTEVTEPIHGWTQHQQHAHPLYRADFGFGFYCNMCYASDPPGQRWRCDVCDYDICHDCWLWAKPAGAGNIVTGVAH